MTYPYGALAMLCFALTQTYTQCLSYRLLANINARSNSLAFSVHLLSTSFIFFLFLLPSFLSPYLSSLSLSLAFPAFFHASLYLIRIIASTILEFLRTMTSHTHLDIYTSASTNTISVVLGPRGVTKVYGKQARFSSASAVQNNVVAIM